MSAIFSRKTSRDVQGAGETVFTGIARVERLARAMCGNGLAKALLHPIDTPAGSIVRAFLRSYNNQPLLEETTMKQIHSPTRPDYRSAMGQLLVLYTQVDKLIMLACAERIGHAPDDAARLGLARQVGDESRHVVIQQEWMRSSAGIEHRY